MSRSNEEEEGIASVFFGVYLLFCENPKYRGRTYIGFTVNPERRIKQHNRGKYFGGAWKTSERGPWKMVLIVHGFPNDIAALRFEWAWQHPKESRRLKHIPKKKSNERLFDYNIRLLSEMLQVGPWCRLPLTVCWLEPEYKRDFPVDRPIPFHMPITCNAIENMAKKPTKKNTRPVCVQLTCDLCMGVFEENNRVKCVAGNCDGCFHMECLAGLFLNDGDYVPMQGRCPKCHVDMLWGDLLKKTDFYKCAMEDSDSEKEADVLPEWSDED